MMKMIIKLDEEKIEKEHIYDIHKMYEYLNDFASKHELSVSLDENKNYVWIPTNLKDQFSIFGFVYNELKWKSWFFYNLKTWILYEPYAFCGFDNCFPSDLIAHWSKQLVIEDKKYGRKMH